MEGGFRLYSPEDIERIDRIRQMKDLLGFSLAEIKDMIEADDVRLQMRAEWRTDADAAEKAAKVRRAREATLQQIAMLDAKMEKMAEMRRTLAERVEKFDARLKQWEAAAPSEAVAAVTS
jgi:DNA-binding transcriptional MerR regulator